MATVEQPVPRKKSRVKEAHGRAIQLYEGWLKKNPKATRKERQEKFDFLVDSAAFDEMVRRGNS